MESVRHLIVGAGVSGLTYADWLDTDDYLICEASDAIGGFCKTVQQDGFVWDYSGHFFHFRHPDIEKYLLDRMADQKVLRVDKKSHIRWADGYVDFPFQRNIHQLPKDDFLACLHDLYFARTEEQATPENFQQMLYAKFGKGIAERFLIPYNEKLYATDLSKLDVDAMGRFFPYADVADVIRQFRAADNESYNTGFTYPEGGAIQYVNAITKGVLSSQISLNERVESIDLESKIATTNRRKIRFDTLVSSAPFPSTLKMTGLGFDPEIYDWNVVEVFNLGFDKKGSPDSHWVYFPQKETSFYRVGFYDNIFGTDRMSLYVELGRPRGFKSTPEETAATLATVLADLKETGVVTNQELVSHHHILLDPAYVHITKDSQKAVEKQKRVLSTRGVYTFGRYGSWTYCSIEDNILEARALADAVNAAVVK